MVSDFETSPFSIKDCALIAIASGKRARNLRELREHLCHIDPGSIYYHFWGGLLRPRFDDPEHHNDFAIWVDHSLHNKRLAERLAVIDPVAFESMEAVRKELIETIEDSLDEIEFPAWTQRDDQFEFIRHQIVVFDTNMTAKAPEDFQDILPEISLGSIFYHFIDARRRNQNSLDDFQNWLMNSGETYEALCQMINDICPYFTSLKELRQELVKVFDIYFEREKL
jgi:hypothetical protein